MSLLRQRMLDLADLMLGAGWQWGLKNILLDDKLSAATPASWGDQQCHLLVTSLLAKAVPHSDTLRSNLICLPILSSSASSPV